MTEIKLFFKYTNDNIKRLEKCPSLYIPNPSAKKINTKCDSNPTVSNAATYDPPLLLYYSLHMNFYVSHIMYKESYFTRDIIVNENDGGTIALDWLKIEKDLPGDAPIVIVGHSLKGGAREPYVRGLVNDAYESFGFRPVVFVNRGCSGLSVTSDIGVSGCNIDDLDLCIDHIKKKYSQSKLFAVGFCFSSLILMRHNLVHGEKSSITAYANISNPVNLGKCLDNISNSFCHKFLLFGRLKPVFVRYFRKYGEERLAKYGCTFDTLEMADGMRYFDEIITSKMFGYGSAQEYYDDCDMPMRNLDKLKKPLLIINSATDTLSASYEELEFDKAKSNDNITIAIPHCGGHMGFISNKEWKQWANFAVLEYFNSFVTK